jgi:hypothetical protein
LIYDVTGLTPEYPSIFPSKPKRSRSQIDRHTEDPASVRKKQKSKKTAKKKKMKPEEPTHL